MSGGWDYLTATFLQLLATDRRIETNSCFANWLSFCESDLLAERLHWKPWMMDSRTDINKSLSTSFGKVSSINTFGSMEFNNAVTDPCR